MKNNQTTPHGFRPPWYRRWLRSAGRAGELVVDFLAELIP